MLPSLSISQRLKSLRQAFALGLMTAMVAVSPAIAQPAPTFDHLMNIGYAASRQGDFNTALINFRRALALQPNQPYAQAAADNMVYYIHYDRTAPRRRAISQLETRLATATSQKDWVCAASTLDQLATYAEPNSLNQERLIGQRGEISGLLDARIDYERWSTVCIADRPVY